VDTEFIHELFSQFGIVQVRRMFGGAGLYAGGIMFGLVFDGVIYLKADTDTAPFFVRENSVPFEYTTKNGKRAVMSYWQLPERLYDDADELTHWARQALEVARSKTAGRSAAKTRKVRKKAKKK
jgi:DNA transformation protein